MHKTGKYGFGKTRFYIFVPLLCLLLFITKAQAQAGDTTKIVEAKDTVILKNPAVLHSPKKAAIYSTMLPGLGQAYNKKYWKIPLIYAAAGALTYAIIFNQENYLMYRTAYRNRLDKDSTTIDQFELEYDDASLLALTQGYHKYRDLSIFGAALLYVLNIVDATVDAHLFNFDVSDNLSLNVRPAFISTAGLNRARTTMTGVSLHLTF